MNYRVLIWAVVFLLAQFRPLSARDEKWLKVSSEHFLLFTDAGETKGRRLLTDFENRAAVFSQAFGQIPQRQFPIEVFLFSNTQDYTDALPRPQGEERLDKSAYLFRGPDRIFIVAKDKSPDDIANDVGHALGHVLFERYVLWRPFWLAEGAAEYFRNVGRSPDKKEIAEDDAFSARDLVTIVPSTTYNDNDKEESGSSFRKQSYRLLRILLEDQPDILRGYLRELRSETETLPTIQIDSESVNARLQSYTETALKPIPVVSAIRVVEADPAEVAIHRGDVLLAAGHEADAAHWYDGRSRDARAARAILTRFARSSAEAVRVLDRAASDLPDNGLVQYHFGALEIPDKKDVRAQVAALERAVQLLPRMGRAYAELARVYALNSQPERSLQMIARALELEPEFGERFYEIRSGLRVASGQFDQALRDINIAQNLAPRDKASSERYIVKVAGIRKEIDRLRREAEGRQVEQLREDIEEEVARLEPPPEPAPPPAPVPAGSIHYQIEARAPIEVLDAVYPEYPEALRKNGVAGTMTFRVDIGPDGKVKAASLLKSQLSDLNTTTLNAVKKWSFQPGNRRIRLTITYSLP